MFSPYTVFAMVELNYCLLNYKVAPTKAKTLPTLELLAVYLTLKCLPFILDSFKLINFNKVMCAVDSQIVLQWLFTGSVSNKNIFTHNHLKDITMYLDTLKRDFGIDIGFKFVKSEDSPCDLLALEFAFAEFQKKYSFWFHGPSWLASSLDN